MNDWLQRDGHTAVDDAGSVVLAWRTATGRVQTEVAAVLGTTQQHLSQIEQGRRPVSLELRRRMVTELGIAPEDLGLSSGYGRKLVSGDGDDAGAQVAASRLRWRDERRWLNQHRAELTTLAAQLYPPDYRVPGIALLAPPEWLPAQPIELGSLTLHLDEGTQTADVKGSEPESASTRPLRNAGQRFERYTSAIKYLSPPALFESRPSYRLLDVALVARRLEFGLAAYFDKIDICEALAHETAAVCMTEGLTPSESLRGSLPFRELIGDPFDPQRRAIVPAIATLTIRRRYPAESSFLLHWRDPAKVAIGGGTYGVIPTGEFQPSGTAAWDRYNDFDLWRNMVREYSEELLGEPEHHNTCAQPIDYEKWPLHQQLQSARANGALTTFVLGVGVDPLTLSTNFLTVVVIDDDVFTDVFGSMIRFNEEGEIAAVGGGTPTEGIPFTHAAVHRMLEAEPLSETAAGCLALTWKHRSALGLGGS